MTFVVYKTVPSCNLYAFSLATAARHSGGIHSQAVKWCQYEDVASNGRGATAYWTVQHLLSFVPALLDVALQRIGVERLQELETT